MGRYVLRTAFRCTLLVVIIASMVEIAARMVNSGYLPIIPYTIERGVPTLPANVSFEVQFDDDNPVRYVTDGNGFRISEQETGAKRSPKVFVAGDSQVLGYGFAFSATFAAIVADAMYGGADRAAILGSPGMDPEILQYAIAAHKQVALADTRLAIIALNLGNDLDEIFTGGSWYRGIDQPQVQGWLIRNSVAYMTYVQRSYAKALDRTLVPGVNRIFYVTSPEERVLLARETADVLLSAAKSIAAQRVIVLIVPQDVQVFPGDFGKYRKYFANADEFAGWEARIPDISSGLRVLEAYIASRMEDAGLNVVRVSRLLPANGNPAVYFSRTSHHLTPAAHRLIAKELLSRMHGEDPGE